MLPPYCAYVMSKNLISLVYKTNQYFLEALSKEVFEVGGVTAYAPTIKEPNLNFAMQTGEIEGRLEELFHKVEMFFEARNLPWFWMLDPSREQTDVKNILHKHGFKIIERYSTFVGFVNDFYLEDTLKKLTLREVEGEKLTDWACPLQDAFQGTEESVHSYLEAHVRALHKGANFHHIVGYVDEEPVCAGTLSASPYGARLDDLGVKQIYQRQGYGKALTFYGMKLAQELGYDWVCLDASDQGAQLYKALGFQELCQNVFYGKSKQKI